MKTENTEYIVNICFGKGQIADIIIADLIEKMKEEKMLVCQ